MYVSVCTTKPVSMMGQAKSKCEGEEALHDLMVIDGCYDGQKRREKITIVMTWKSMDEEGR